MGFCNWLPGLFWIFPLLMLVMVVFCVVMMLRGRHAGGCCSFGGHHRVDGRTSNSIGNCTNGRRWRGWAERFQNNGKRLGSSSTPSRQLCDLESTGRARSSAVRAVDS